MMPLLHASLRASRLNALKENEELEIATELQNAIVLLLSLTYKNEVHRPLILTQEVEWSNCHTGHQIQFLKV
jgi:hypothetical protein